MVGEEIEEEEEEEVIDEAVGKIDQIRKAAGDFRNNVAGIVEGMHVESNDWHFNVERNEKGVAVDVAIKLLITKKK